MLDELVQCGECLVFVPCLEDQRADMQAVVGRVEWCQLGDVGQGLLCAEGIGRLLAQGRMYEEAVEVLHDVADGVVGDDEVLGIG